MYYWKAFFLNGEIICQYENGNEILFKEVLDRINFLEKFCLIKDDNSIYFEINLNTGVIDCNNSLIEVVSEKNAGLIYKRRNTFNFNTKIKNITYIIGISYNEEESTELEINDRIFLLEKNKLGISKVDITDKIIKR